MLDFDNLRMIVVVRGQVRLEFKNINKKSTDYLAKLTPLPPPSPPTPPPIIISPIVTLIMTESQSWKIFDPQSSDHVVDAGLQFSF